MSRTLIIAEHDGQNLNPSTSKCASCATAIGHEFDIVVIGASIDEIASQAAAIDGTGSVIAVSAEHLANPLATNHAAEVLALADSYSHILGPSTTYGRDLMPRIAALLGVNQVSDISAVEGPYHFKRPIYAGNAIVDVQAPASVKLVATVRVASWKAAGSGGSATVEARSASAAASSHTRYVDLKSGAVERPDLQTAARVISGGRALASKENFELIYSLADLIGAGAGASRAAPLTLATARTICRWVRPVRSSRRIFISLSVYPVRSSTSPESRTPEPLLPSIKTRTRPFSKCRTSVWPLICSR